MLIDKLKGGVQADVSQHTRVNILLLVAKSDLLRL